MQKFDSNNRFENKSRQINSNDGNLTPDEDFIMEQILENLTTTPIGQVLNKIASLPEVRQEKVLDVRRQISEGKYELNERLDVALDRVLEELTT